MQKSLPTCRNPYAEIAETLNSDENAVLEGTRGLYERGVIRRIGAIVNWQAAGKATTLVTAHIADEKLKPAVEAVNRLEGCSHNYLREHDFNLWFTLREDSAEHIEGILRNLSRRFGVVFHSLPAVRTFKLDVRFDAESEGRHLLKPAAAVIQTERVEFDETDEKILSQLHSGLEVVAQPYDRLCEEGPGIDDILARIRAMLDKGVIHRLGAVVNHRELGFEANAMFVCVADQNRVVEVGKALADLRNVSHCYERRPFEGWPYNLFAMIHGPNMEEVDAVIKKFVQEKDIKTFELLATVKNLKK